MSDTVHVMERLGVELLPRAVAGADAEAALLELETAIGVRLPAGYRQFLPAWGGAFLPGSVLFQVGGNPPFGNQGLLDVVFGLLPGNGYDVAENWRGAEGRLPNDLLPVAQDPGGNLICLGIRGPRTGHVLFWDHNGALFGRDAERSIYPLAGSWSEFLDGLRRE